MKRIALIPALLLAAFSLLSFTINKLNNDFLKELGITKTEADKKISTSILRGYLDMYGLRNAKNIALGNRKAVASDLLTYTKQYITTGAFKKEYDALRESSKPVQQHVTTPDEMRKENANTYRSSIAEMQNALKNATAATRPIYEQSIADSKKYLQEVEDPNNKQIATYAKNYPAIVKNNQQAYDEEIKRWELQYPANHLLFVKQRLQQFMDETKDIDFTAELVTKNNKKIFVNPAYESKSRPWKMAFRAGKDVVDMARAFVENWLNEIK